MHSWLKTAVAAVVVVVLSVAGVAGGAAAAEFKIYTGGQSGSYYNDFGPKVKGLLDAAFLPYEVVTSAGSAANIASVAANPLGIGLTQSDVLALAIERDPSLQDKLTVIRADVAFECLFAVTRPDVADRLQSWGDVQAYARRLRVVTGSESSGSAATVSFLQSLSDQFGRARIDHLAGTDAAIDAVVGGNADIAFFVQFPNVDNPRFKAINDAKLAFVPVVDRTMLRQRAGGEQVYVAREVKVTPASLLSWSGVQKVTTACTPIAYITGNPAALAEGSNERLDLDEVITRVRAADAADLRPGQGWFRKLFDDAVELSGRGLEVVLEKAEEAAAQIRQ